MYPKILPEVRGGAQRAEGSVVEGKLLYYCLINVFGMLWNYINSFTLCFFLPLASRLAFLAAFLSKYSDQGATSVVIVN